MIKPWITLTVADVEQYLLAPQLSALRSAALGQAQGDPLPEIIADVVGHVRAKIASCPRNTLDANPATIPPSLKAQACYTAIFRAQLRIPVLKMTDHQIKAYDNAREDLNRIASCTDAVEQPQDAAPASTAALTPAYTTPERRLSHARQDGI